MPFCKFCKENNIPFKQNEPMKNHTSFKIGGNADFYVECCSDDCLKSVVTECNRSNLPYFIIGKGSNILVSDKGVEGVVISLCGFCEASCKGDIITVGAGVSLANLCILALENELSGLEFAYGIPGSVGGALYMNAGAYGGEMSQVVISAKAMDKTGNIREVKVGDMGLGYRESIFKTNGEIVLSVSFKLKKDKKSDIKARMDDFMARRKDKQPLEFPSAGSTFKRPLGHFAGALIEKNNLKGVSVGGAMVSDKHAGFVINYDNATAEDVKELMKKIKEVVRKNDGVELEPEVIFIGKE